MCGKCLTLVRILQILTWVYKSRKRIYQPGWLEGRQSISRLPNLTWWLLTRPCVRVPVLVSRPQLQPHPQSSALIYLRASRAAGWQFDSGGAGAPTTPVWSLSTTFTWLGLIRSGPFLWYIFTGNLLLGMIIANNQDKCSLSRGVRPSVWSLIGLSQQRRCNIACLLQTHFQS